MEKKQHHHQYLMVVTLMCWRKTELCNSDVCSEVTVGHSLLQCKEKEKKAVSPQLVKSAFVKILGEVDASNAVNYFW